MSAETGCGKTTVVQLYQVLLRRRLQIVNCHANTDTSDLLGGLRPLRSRSSILSQMMEHVQQLQQIAQRFDLFVTDIPDFKIIVAAEINYDQEKLVQKIMDYVKCVESLIDESGQMLSLEESVGKRRKIDHIDAGMENLKELISSVRNSFKRYYSLFEWVDGPLVSAMKQGKSNNGFS